MVILAAFDQGECEFTQQGKEMKEQTKTTVESAGEGLRAQKYPAKAEHVNREQQNTDDRAGWGEHRLKESEERYRVAIEHSNDAVAITKDDRLLYVNGRFCEVFGFDSPDEILGRPLAITVHPEDRERVTQVATSKESGTNGPVRYEFKGVRKDGTIAYIEASTTKTYLAGESVSLAYLKDITARRQTESTLDAHIEKSRQSERRTKALVSAMADTVLGIGADGRIVDFNVGRGQHAFFSQYFTIGRFIADTPLPPYVVDRVMRIVRQDGAVSGTDECEWTLTGDNGVRAFKAWITRSVDNETTCIIRDVSEIAAAKQAVREAEDKLKRLSEQSVAGVYLLQGNQFLYVNRQFAEVFGYEEDEIVNKKSPGDLACGADKAKILSNIEKGFSGETDSLHYEFSGMKKNGQPVSVEVHGSLTTHRGRPAVIGTLLDVSDRKKLEAQLVQSEKMKAIGTLAGGIAHDFNNILMAIQGYTSLMLHLLEPVHPHYGKLKGIEDLVTSGSDLTKQLLAFASGGTFEIRPADLNEIVRKTSTMFARTRKEITIQTSYDSGAPVVDVDSGQMDQVLLNLYVNAWHAMPGGGTLTLLTETVALDRKFTRPFGVKPGKFAKVSVTDTGIGMDEKTRERIFEPFFTTKKRERGTGLGLASVYNIVVGHGGIIQVESEPGCGTTFHIYLPLSKKTIEKHEAAPETLLNGKETVLLVDDEETVISVSRDMLEALGYSVITALSGKEACEVYRAQKTAVDLVILDVIMPDMGGEETFAELFNINPSVKVILSSGYSLDGLAARIMERGCKAFIQKPFTISTLSQKLREVLSPND